MAVVLYLSFCTSILALGFVGILQVWTPAIKSKFEASMMVVGASVALLLSLPELVFGEEYAVPKPLFYLHHVPYFYSGFCLLLVLATIYHLQKHFNKSFL